MADHFRANARTTGTVAVGGSATGVIEKRNDVDSFAVEPVAGRIYVIDLEGWPSGEVRAVGDRDWFAVELDVARHVASMPISAIRDRSPSIVGDQGPPLGDSHDHGAGTRDGFRFILKPLVTSERDGT